MDQDIGRPHKRRRLTDDEESSTTQGVMDRVTDVLYDLLISRTVPDLHGLKALVR